MRSLANIATFIQVASTRSFAEASTRLGLSTSATSKAVARLEEELGVKLLHRTTRSVGLTPEGERFLEGASRLIGEMEALTNEISDSMGTPRGRLAVSAPAVFGRVWLASKICDFQKRYPEITVELSLDDREVDLAADSFDVVIRTGALADNVNLVARRFFDDQLYMCATPDYLDTHGRPRTIADLKDHACLMFRNASQGRIFPWRLSVDGETVNGSFNSPLVINDAEALATAVMGGAGICQLPSYTVRSALLDGRLEEVLPDFRPDPYPYSILYLDRRLVSPRIRVFIDYLIEHRPQCMLKAMELKAMERMKQSA